MVMGTGAAPLYNPWNTVEAAFRHMGKVADLYYESAVVLVSLISLSKYFEATSRSRIPDTIGALMSLTPEIVLHLPAPDRADQAEEAPIRVVHMGDYLQVKPGGRTPVDGMVTNDAPSVDASMPTGGSMPIPIGVGSSMAGGTMSTAGSLTIRAGRAGTDTASSRIVKLVHETQSSKALVARLIDDVNPILAPTVTVLAVVADTGRLYWGHVPVSEALCVFVAVLVVACSCALGLAAPISVMMVTDRGV